jgi:hypothetical protein
MTEEHFTNCHNMWNVNRNILEEVHTFFAVFLCAPPPPPNYRIFLTSLLVFLLAVNGGGGGVDPMR